MLLLFEQDLGSMKIFRHGITSSGIYYTVVGVGVKIYVLSPVFHVRFLKNWSSLCEDLRYKKPLVVIRNSLAHSIIGIILIRAWKAKNLALRSHLKL